MQVDSHDCASVHTDINGASGASTNNSQASSLRSSSMSSSTLVGGLLPTMPNHRHGKMRARDEGCKGPIIESSEWAIEAVVFGDGSKDKRGRELKRGQFYGSAKTTGRHENFHPIDFQSIDVSKHGRARVELTTRGVSNDMPRGPLCLLSGTTSDEKSYLSSTQGRGRTGDSIVLCAQSRGCGSSRRS